MNRIAAVIPAFNADWCIERSVRGLLEAGFAPQDVIVADDGSTDSTAEIAGALGVRLLRLTANSGAAAARNAGAALTDADIILFVDADVVVHPDVRTRVLESLGSSSACDAVFGLYDDVPHCRRAVGQFRNLLHHFVHLQGPEQLHSFWTGCGAVRRSAFGKVGGFDPRMRMMEDIEFGMRLSAAGGQVQIDRQMRAQHLKCWSLAGMIHMDVHDRAIPWSRLLLFRHGLVNELNLDWRHRASAVAVLLMVSGLALAPLNPRWLLLPGVALLVFMLLNRSFHALAFRRLGLLSGLAAIPLHIIHTLCAIAGFGWVFLTEFMPARLFRRPVSGDPAPVQPPDCPPTSDRRL